MDINAYLQPVIDWSLSVGLRLLVIIIIALVALKGGKMFLGRVFDAFKGEDAGEETAKRINTLKSVVQYVVTVVVLVVAGMTILNELGINIGPVLAAAGIVGVAVGFGAQQLVQDIISGFFILMENQIRVGDVVQIAGKGGVVEKVNLRMTILRDLSGNVHYVRNGKIDLVTNMTKDFSYHVLSVGVAYRENVDEVMTLLSEIGEELRSDPKFTNDILEPMEVLGVDELADSAVVIKARMKTKPIKQWGIGRELNRRLKIKFDEKNIEIPFPQVTVHMTKDHSE